MRQFASSGFRIWNLSREAKLVYTGFGLFALLALAVSMLFYEDLVGPDTGGVRAYYAGEASGASRDASREAVPSGMPRSNGEVKPVEDHAAAGGPAIALPPTDDAPKLTVAVTYRKLLEVTHFHLFTVPVFLLIIAHLFMLTGARWKAAWIVGAWASSLLHLGAPWLIRYGSASFSFLYPLSGALMGLTLTVMTIYPIVVMWLPHE